MRKITELLAVLAARLRGLFVFVYALSSLLAS